MIIDEMVYELFLEEEKYDIRKAEAEEYIKGNLSDLVSR